MKTGFCCLRTEHNTHNPKISIRSQVRRHVFRAECDVVEIHTFKTCLAEGKDVQVLQGREVRQSALVMLDPVNGRMGYGLSRFEQALSQLIEGAPTMEPY